MLAPGLAVPGDMLSRCNSVLIDIEAVSLQDVPEALKVMGVSEFLQISSDQAAPLTVVVAERSEIDAALLGRATCLLVVDPQIAIESISSGSQPFDIDLVDSVRFVQSGEIVDIPIENLDQSSIVITGEFDGNSTIHVDGKIVYAGVQNTIWVLLGLTAFLILFLVIMVTMGILRRRRHSTITDVSHE